ncbi:hypothetical protein BKP35_09470 [Anaerobacillus arseniciselenatis]|uniref:ABC transporter domain-containing protein n=1 Tax=Anaerobacillus arseniciselenatis TaxID=85682 RepID=A0A1S2LJT4_9BACI|nr:adenosylcobinamide amidohydrolase [Anaerobacillus arseniciselenatis]OIJ12798.1 hypothetical protein BKP35_09470 [Anaerobacillus arseniciselenatis]
MLKIRNLVGGYTNTPIINGVDFEISKGEFFVLLGPNGSGKSTIFKLITGQLPCQKGEISINDKSLSSFSKLEKAKKVAVLSQEVQISFDYTVEEIISLGRFPHQKGLFKTLSVEDKEVIEEVMEITKVKQYRDTQFRMISGGEKQRVLLAKVLAQQPEVLLLDEPTNHLDIKHTFQMLDLLKEWQQTKGLTIFAILHDLNVAALYADRIALLHKGSFLDVGDVDTLRKESQLETVYEVKVNAQSHPTVPKPQLLMTPNHSKTKSELLNFDTSFSITKNDQFIHVQFESPLRTISNGVIGEGIQWLKHFCNFHVEKHYNGSNPKQDLQKWMEKYEIPFEQSVAMMTAVRLEDVVIVTKQIEDIKVIAVVTAGTGNAVDITNSSLSQSHEKVGTINSMVFIDAHFTDGALVNGFMSATEAKVKALHDLNVKDPETNTMATSTSTDALLLAVTQQGKETQYAGSGTVVGKVIGQTVYEATHKAVQKYFHRLQK